MRVARTTLIALIPSLIVFAAVPAAAKPGHGHEREPTAVGTISGRALDAPVLLNDERAWHVLYLTTFRGYGLGGAEPSNADRLGPELRAHYRFVQPNGRVQTLEQTLHCAGDGRIWSYTAPGQDRVRLRTGSPVRSGWWHSAALVTVIPEVGVACERRDAAAGVPPPGPPSLTGLWVGLAALAALAAVGALERASRRRRLPARI